MKNAIDTEKINYLEEIKAEDIKLKDFRKLKAYKLSLELCKECFETMNTFPNCEINDLGDQLRSSCKKVPIQIAEGNGSIFTKRELYFLAIALGSLSESQAHLDIARVYGFISTIKHNEIDALVEEIKRLLIAYIKAMLDKR